jgi:PAS domain-containing protein
MSSLDSRLTFSVGEVASMLGISPHTIRAWERRHRTLRPVRTSSGQRRYSPEDIELLRQIKFERHAHGLSMRVATLTAQGILVPEEDDDRPEEERAAAQRPDGTADPIRMVANLVDEIVIVLDQEGRIDDANTAFLRFSDLLPRRVRGLRFADFIDPFDRAKGVQAYASPLRRRRGWELNVLGSRRRALFAFDCWPVTGPDGPRVILIGKEVAATGVTAGVRASAPPPEPPVSVFPMQLLALLDGAPDPVRVLDLFEGWMASSTFGVALASLAPTPAIVRSNAVFQRVAAGGVGIVGLPLRDLWGGRPNDPLAVAVERAARSAEPERISGWIAPSGSDGSHRLCEVEIVPLRGPSGEVTHLVLRAEDVGAGNVPKHGDRLLAAVVALRAATDVEDVYAVASERVRDLIRGAGVLIARSSDPPGAPTIVASDAWSTSGERTDPDLRVSLVHEVTRTGAHLDLRWDTSDGLEILRAVPVTSRRGAGSAVLGVFVFARKGGEPFTISECDLMDEFADRVALALNAIPAPGA